MLKKFLQGRALNHPLHPMLVHLPVGLWVASLIFDALYLVNGNSFFAVVSYYSILIGIVGALVAAPAGFAEYVDIPKNSPAKQMATVHFSLNILAIALYASNFFARSVSLFGAETVSGPQFLLTLVGITVLGIAGYFGGLLVYRYGVGLRLEEQKREETPKKAA